MRAQHEYRACVGSSPYLTGAFVVVVVVLVLIKKENPEGSWLASLQ